MAKQRDWAAACGVAAAWAAVLAVAGVAGVATGQTATIGRNFTGLNFNDSGFRPPDTMGAVGPAHYVELINGAYGVFDKVTGARLRVRSLDQFFVDAGVTPVDFSFDPRVYFDAATQRWFAVAVDASRSPNSAFLVAVSNGSNPLNGWRGFRIDADTNNQQWADFPTAGLDADGFYIFGNMFGVIGNEPFELNLLVLPKRDLIAGSVANRRLVEDVDFGTFGFALQPAVDLDGSGLPLPVLSEFNTPAGQVAVSRIQGTLAAPSVVRTSVTTVPAFQSPADAPQPPFPNQKQALDSGDTRFSGAAVLTNGWLWGVQTVSFNGRSALRVLRLNPTTGALAESDTLSSTTLHFYYPSIAVTPSGGVVVGCSGSSTTQPVSAYAFVGQFDGASTVYGSPLLLRAGVDDYQILDGSGRNRWGDYSATALDPSDPNRIWTIQQYVAGNDLWGTQITELVFAPCQADIDGNNVLNIFDIFAFFGAFGGGNTTTADFTGDGVLNVFDIFEFFDQFGAGCP